MPYKNEDLLARLKKHFTKVKVSNESASITVAYYPDYLYRKGRLKANVSEWGETYYVNCPLCSDTRQRLAISHHWSVRDQKTRDDMLHLAICHNEGCLKTRENQKKLHSLLYPEGRWALEFEPPAIVSMTAEEAKPARKIVMPPGIKLTKLPLTHPAHQYLRRRGFDSMAIAKKYGVEYVDRCLDCEPKLNDRRIVIPIYQPALNQLRPIETELVSWQARHIDADGPYPPKYMTATGSHRNQLLYGLPDAIGARGLVIVEGPMDVWRVGPPAVALLGKTLSQQQCQLIGRHFRNRPVVVLLDAAATTEAEEVKEHISEYREEMDDPGRVLVAHVPPSAGDPGACTPEEIIAAVRLAQGLSGKVTPGTATADLMFPPKPKRKPRRARAR